MPNLKDYLPPPPWEGPPVPRRAQMDFYVVRDHRFPRGARRGWNPVAPYTPKDVMPLTIAPADILAHWQSQKEALGYAPIRGLSSEQLLTLTALARGAKARLGISPFGDIYAYKLVDYAN